MSLACRVIVEQADKLRRQAKELRSTDKTRALHLVKAADILDRQARHISIQEKRANRGAKPVEPPPTSKGERREPDDVEWLWLDDTGD
jgi:hypothetical protein